MAASPSFTHSSVSLSLSLSLSLCVTPHACIGRDTLVNPHSVSHWVPERSTLTIQVKLVNSRWQRHDDAQIHGKWPFTPSAPRLAAGRRGGEGGVESVCVCVCVCVGGD